MMGPQLSLSLPSWDECAWDERVAALEKGTPMVLIPPDSLSEFDDPEMDWDTFDALTHEEVRAAVEADPDVQPVTEEQWRRAMRRVDLVALRERFGLSQEQFADRFLLPLGQVQAWEANRSFPSHGYHLYLCAIAAWAPPEGFDG